MTFANELPALDDCLNLFLWRVMSLTADMDILDICCVACDAVTYSVCFHPGPNLVPVAGTHCPCSFADCDPWVPSAWESEVFSSREHQHVKEFNSFWWSFCKSGCTLPGSPEWSVQNILRPFVRGFGTVRSPNPVVYVTGVTVGFAGGTGCMPMIPLAPPCKDVLFPFHPSFAATLSHWLLLFSVCLSFCSSPLLF